MYAGKAIKNDKLIVNILTLSTFVGSGIGCISAVWQYRSIDENYSKMQHLLSGDSNRIPNFAKDYVNEEALNLTQQLAENKLALFILSILGSLLCIYAAFQMRKLKKEGYYLYIIGAILPFVTFPIIMNWRIMQDRFLIANAVISVIFIFFYSTQRKVLLTP